MEEKYRALMEAVHASEGLRTEVLNMTQRERRTDVRRRLRPAVAAAAAVLIVAVTALAAGAATGFDFVRFFSGKDGIEWNGVTYTDGFEASGGLACFPVEMLSEEARAAAASAQGEGTAELNVPSWEAVEQLLGVELPMSQVIEERGELRGFGVSYDNGPSNHYQCRVRLIGEDLRRVEIQTGYQIDGVDDSYAYSYVGVDVLFLTDAATPEERDESWFSYLNISSEPLNREDYLTAGGLEAVIVEHEPYNAYNALFVLDGIGYRVSIQAGTDAGEAEKDTALALLKEVLDGF